MLKNYDEIKKYLLNHRDVAVDVAREINCYNGRLPFVDTWDLTELIECYCNDYGSTKDFLDNVILNSLDTLPRDIDTPVRFDECGTYLEAADDETVQDEVEYYINDIMTYLDELWEDEDIYIEDRALLDLLFDFDKAVEAVQNKAIAHYKSSEITSDVLNYVAKTYFSFNDEQLELLKNKFETDEIMAF